MIKHFVNLTNGLEWTNELLEYEYIRIESTAIERKEWNRIFRDLDANFLMNLAMGVECHVYDCGAGREMSKTIRIALPMIISRMSRMWIYGEDIPALSKEERDVKRKLGYFRRYLNTDRLKLIGHSKSTYHDGNKLYYRNLVNCSRP